MRRRMTDEWRNGFTLIEALVVIAIIGLLVGVVITDFSRQADLWSVPNDHESLSRALLAARTSARAGRVSIHYVESRSALVISSGRELASFPLKGRVSFSLPEDESGGGSVNLARLDFAPEGDSTPARILIEGQGKPVVYRLEPFSGALSEEVP